jgi:hypothetical protein
MEICGIVFLSTEKSKRTSQNLSGADKRRADDPTTSVLSPLPSLHILTALDLYIKQPKMAIVQETSARRIKYKFDYTDSNEQVFHYISCDHEYRVTSMLLLPADL